MLSKIIKYIFLSFLFFTISFLPGCSKNKIIDEEEFVKIYTDIVIAQDTSNVAANKFDSLKTVIFKRHGITNKEYSSTIEYFNKDPQRWEKFFDKVIAYIDKLRMQSSTPDKSKLPVKNRLDRQLVMLLRIKFGSSNSN